MAGVHLAGVLQPPRVAGDAGKKSYDLLAAEAFARDPKTWYPSIEPILARLATEIRFWQIGDDRDPGWIGCRDLPGIVSRTKAELDRIGQDLDIGIAWNIAAPLPMSLQTPSPIVPAMRRPQPCRPRMPTGRRRRGIFSHCPAMKRSATPRSHSAWTARNRRASLVGSCWMPCPEKAMPRASESPTWSIAC